MIRILLQADLLVVARQNGERGIKLVKRAKGVFSSLDCTLLRWNREDRYCLVIYIRFSVDSFRKSCYRVRALMSKIKKTSLFVFVLAVVFSTGSSCVFPMLPAQASSGAMQVGDQSALVGQGETIDGHDMGPMAHAPLPQEHVKTCSADCGQTADDAVTTKKDKELLDLLAPASQCIFMPSSPLNGSDLEAFERSEIPPLGDALLTVAKKE